MPSGFPRAIVYDAMARCHFTVVVRHDKGYFTYWCADHEVEERFPLDMVGDFKAAYKALPGGQIVSWIEVTDDGL